MDQRSLFSTLEPVRVCDEAFKLFHSIDRELFSRLLHNLGRDRDESIRAMAFWMWLERESKDMYLIKSLLALPLPLLDRVADETVLCLLCLQSDRFLYGDEVRLALLPEIVNDRINKVISLRLFHDNRIIVARALDGIINTVCARAFDDILSVGRIGVPLCHHLPNIHINNVCDNVLAPPSVVGAVPLQMVANCDEDMGDSNITNYNIINQLINNIIDDDDHGSLEVPADDRTIFLTFSRGYPITEDELTEFFTRRFGDFVEDLIMQEVGDDEQVLYARLVARSTDLIHRIVGGSKAKYVINGKHVWARKYVKKQHHPST